MNAEWAKSISLTLLFVVLVMACSPDPDLGSTPNSVSWEGAWENGTDLYGTFSITMTFSGENMDRNGGSGTIDGSVIWTGFNGADVLSATLSGTWENDLSSNHDQLEYTVNSSDGRLSLSDYVDYETAAEITDTTFSMGNFSLDSNTGGWHTSPDNDGIKSLNVSNALLINLNDEFLDMTYVGNTGEEIYATTFDGTEYKIVSINLADGAVSAKMTTCAEPKGITYDGTDSWVVGKAVSGDSSPTLFKYNGTNFESEQITPLENADLSSADTLSYLGIKLYYHNGSILSSTIGSIDQAIGSVTPE